MKIIGWYKLKGYVAKNYGEYDIENMTFCKTLSKAKKWKGQEICKVEIHIKMRGDDE